MRHINELQRALGRDNAELWTTNDPNIVAETYTSYREIHVNKLTERVAELEAILAEKPIKIDNKTPEDVASLIETENSHLVDRQQLAEQELEELNTLVAKMNQ